MLGGWIAPRTVQRLAPAPGTPAIVDPGALYPPVWFCHPKTLRSSEKEQSVPGEWPCAPYLTPR